jgi:hypothetical protein
MKNAIHLKKASTLEVDDCLLCPQFSGIVLAHKVAKVESLDEKRVQITMDDTRIHVVNLEDTVAVVV